MILTRNFARLILTCALIVAASSYTIAQPILRLPAIIGDHAVLQAQSDIKLWGWADPRGEVKIVASWSPKDTISVKVGGDTKWIATLKTPAAGGPYTIDFITRKAKLKIKDILLGQVWLCGGQSNMNWNAENGIIDMREELKSKMNPQLRLFTVTRCSAEYPQQDCEGKWEVCTPESARWFSAVGYFFGKRLSAELKQPVGLINSSWGGSPAETWTPAEALKSKPHLIEQWSKVPKSTGWDINIGSTYNAMIYPILNTALSGVIWYQGEANIPNAATYDELFSTLITSWREKFSRELPFYFVQIAPYGKYAASGAAAILREKQAFVAAGVPKVGMVSIPDQVDDILNIHPKYKAEVGNRLARWALGEVYGKNAGKYKHPTYKSMEVKGNRIVISFDNIEGALTSKGGKPSTVEICDRSMKFVPAEAEIDPKNNTLVVWGAQVGKPVAARYSFTNDAMGNLFDASGLPVAPFRTDADNAAVSATFPSDPVSGAAVKIVGNNYKKMTLNKGTMMFPNRTYPITQLPAEFAGFQMLTCAADNVVLSEKCIVTPYADGKVYILARKNAITEPALVGWTLVKNSEVRYKTRAADGVLYIFCKEAKAGEAVELPRVKDFARITPLAKSIQY